MADVTTTFAAKDESFAKTVDKLSGRLQEFQSETASFSEKVGGMASAFARFAGPIAAMAAAFLGARSAAQAFTNAINVGGQLAELSQRTGETAGNLAILQRAFTNAGSSGEAVGSMLNRLQRFMAEAANGGNAQAAAMSKLGTSFSDLAGKTPLEQMKLLAERISAIHDPAQRSAMAMEIFGRSGGELLPLLRNMGAELDNARAQLGSYPEAADRAAEALDGIGDNFGAITTKAQEFITGALVNIAPELEKALVTIAQIDFTRLGMNLSDAFLKAYDFFRGLWANPSQIFGLIGDYFNATFRQAGDSLVSAFLTAGNALSNFLNELVSSGAFSQLGDVLANAFGFGASKFNLAMFDAIESVMNFFGNLWNSVTGQGVQGLATKLLDVVRFFASDFVQAMTNPAGFVANKLSSALIGATKSASNEYRFAFDSATGSYIDKARSGLNAVVTGSGDRLRQSASDFGNTLIMSAQTAAANTEIIETNLFGGAEAIKQVNDKVAAIANAGTKFRTPMEESVEPATKIKDAISDLPVSGKSLKDVLNDSFPYARAIKEEAKVMHAEGRGFAGAVNAAKIDAQITSDLFKGLSERMNSATNATSSMLDKMRETFHFGQMSQKEITDYNRMENRLMNAEERRERAYRRAQDMEDRGYESAARRARTRADAEYTKTLEKLQPQLKEGAEKAQRSLKEGGADAAKSITKAAEAFKDAVSDASSQLALESTLQACRDFLSSIDKKLPQHALVP